MAKNAPHGLEALPNELLDGIATLLDRPTLYTLALVCKKINVSANIALYNTYTNHDPPPEAPFRLFLRTMCEVPRLAALVKAINIRGWRSEFEVATGAAWRGFTAIPDLPEPVTQRGEPSFSSVDRAPPVASNDFKLFLETAIRIGLVDRPSSDFVAPLKAIVRWDQVLKKDEDFVRLLKHGVEDAHFILLCALVPNLDALVVAGLSMYPTLDWYKFLSRPKDTLQNLAILRICGSPPRSGEPVLKTTMQVLDIVPRLRELWLENMSVQGYRHTVESLTTKEIGRFHFIYCAIRHRLLKKIFAGQRVDVLYYIPNLDAIRTVNTGATFSESEITEALGPSKNTVQTLSLYATRPSEKPRTGEYSCLQSLDIPYFELLPLFKNIAAPDETAEILRLALPRSLRSFFLGQCLPDKGIVAILKQLAAMKTQGHLPNIERVTLIYVAGLPMFDVIRDNLKDSFADVMDEARIDLKVEMEKL